jgi:hypothetical protein
VTAPADVTIQLAGNTVVLRVVRAGVPVPHVVVKLDREDPGGTPLSTDDHGELRLLREHARAETVSLRPQGRLPLSVEFPLDTAPDQPIVIEIGGVPTARIVFDVTSAVPVQQFSATSAVTSYPLAPGRWEVTLDLGGRGEHRRTVEVRPCEIADAELTL